MEPRKRVNRGPPGWDDRKAITSRRYRQGGGDRGGVVPRRGFPRVIERGMAESGAVGTEETSRGRASVWRPDRLGRRVPKALGGVGGRHRTQSAGKPRTGGRRSTVSAGSSRRFPHTAEDAKRMRDGSASPAPASNRGAGCVNGARPVLRGVRAQGDQVGSPRALARKGQHRLIGAKATAPRPASTYPWCPSCWRAPCGCSTWPTRPACAWNKSPSGRGQVSHTSDTGSKPDKRPSQRSPPSRGVSSEPVRLECPSGATPRDHASPRGDIHDGHVGCPASAAMANGWPPTGSGDGPQPHWPRRSARSVWRMRSQS